MQGEEREFMAGEREKVRTYRASFSGSEVSWSMLSDFGETAVETVSWRLNEGVVGHRRWLLVSIVALVNDDVSDLFFFDLFGHRIS